MAQDQRKWRKETEFDRLRSLLHFYQQIEQLDKWSFNRLILNVTQKCDAMVQNPAECLVLHYKVTQNNINNIYFFFMCLGTQINRASTVSSARNRQISQSRSNKWLKVANKHDRDYKDLPCILINRHYSLEKSTRAFDQLYTYREFAHTCEWFAQVRVRGTLIEILRNLIRLFRIY